MGGAPSKSRGGVRKVPPHTARGTCGRPLGCRPPSRLTPGCRPPPPPRTPKPAGPVQVCSASGTAPHAPRTAKDCEETMPRVSSAPCRRISRSRLSAVQLTRHACSASCSCATVIRPSRSWSSSAAAGRAVQERDAVHAYLYKGLVPHGTASHALAAASHTKTVARALAGTAQAAGRRLPTKDGVHCVGGEHPALVQGCRYELVHMHLRRVAAEGRERKRHPRELHQPLTLRHCRNVDQPLAEVLGLTEMFSWKQVGQ
jgi:hypothetical protein